MTELIWDGKFGADDKKVAPVWIAPNFAWSTHTSNPVKYTVLVKTIDILRNDTTEAMEVKV